MRRLLPCVLAIAASAPALAEPTAAEVLAAFRKAGLEAEQPTKMQPKNYGFAPYVCKGTRFLIPSLGEDSGGRVFECPNDADRDLIARYYQEMGRKSAMAFSWVLVKGRIVVQINGELDETIAEKYQAALP